MSNNFVKGFGQRVHIARSDETTTRATFVRGKRESNSNGIVRIEMSGLEEMLISEKHPQAENTKRWYSREAGDTRRSGREGQ